MSHTTNYLAMATTPTQTSVFSTPAGVSDIPTPSTPSIASAAMLVELSIRTWTGRKLDKKASEEVTTTNRASKGVANVNKKILGDCAELDAVQKFAANARNAHYGSTLPWSDTGIRLLTTSKYFEYNKAMTALQNEFNRLVEKFLQAYAWEVSQAQLRLGDLFNHGDYPSTDSLRSRFSFGINFMPVPEAGDFRLDINNEAQQEITQHYKRYYETQLQGAMNNIWERAKDALTKMSERLDYADHQTKKIFRDSLVDNVMEVVDLMGACNITGDQKMTTIQNRLHDALLGVTPDALREDEYLRLSTKQQIDDAIKALPSLDI